MRILQQYRLLLLTIIVVSLTSGIQSQVVVSEGTSIGLTPLQFVETYLVGSGVSVSNALYNGSDEPLNSTNRIPLKYRDQIGSFTDSGGAQTQLGIGGGVILSTGYTRKAIAGNDPDDNMWGTSPGESDPDLVILAGGSAINDKSVLEFDFVPQTDIMTFRYVFGSIEFDGFCSSINDAFGLFLSGPGISGGLGFTNDAVNIALLPNSANYVNIFNICAADQGNLGLGVYSWWNLKKDYFSYNRLTYVFTASYTVQCNQSYHMKFAIGDASDGVLDSGVFLEQNSFSSNNVTSSTSFSNPLTGQFLIEGCCNTSLVYSVPQAPTSDIIIDLAIHPSGTASQADILPNPFPVHAVILAGQLQTTPILIIPVPDAMPEPMENLVIKGSTLICNISASITNEFFIKDYNLLTVDMSNVTICDGSSVTLTPSVSGGQPVLPDNNYIYLWNTGDTTTSIVVTPAFGHHLYSVTVTDACSQLAAKEISVDVGTTPVSAGAISGTDTICTPVNGLTYEIPVITGADSYIWILPSGSTITSGNNTNSITVDFNETTASGLISVHGHSNFCGDGMSSNLNLFINPSAPAAGAITGPVNPVCQGTTVFTYSIEPLNFISSYEWTIPTGVTILSGANTNQITCTFGTNAVSGDFKVRGFNSDCGFGQQAVKSVIVDPLPGPAGSIGSINGNTFCKPQTGALFEVSSILYASNYLWIYTGLTGQTTNNGAQFLIDFTVSSSSGTLTVTGQNGCGSGSVSPVFPITVNPKPNVDFFECQESKTTKNGRPFRLRGGRPSAAGGIYTGPGVQEPFPGVFTFNPADNSVIGGSATLGVGHTVVYRYTNIYNCFGEKTFIISVFSSNANNPCPGIIKDVRDDKTYPTFHVGTGENSRCWTTVNLGYGAFTDQSVSQTDNCLPEKYCRNNESSQCESCGGFYQWDEMMQYQQTDLYQDLCMPGWHVATKTEWQMLIDFSLGNGIAGDFLKDMLLTDGFHGVPFGIYLMNNSWSHFSGYDYGTMYWTAEPITANSAVARGLNTINSGVSFYLSSRANAFSVRCVKNLTP